MRVSPSQRSRSRAVDVAWRYQRSVIRADLDSASGHQRSWQLVPLATLESGRTARRAGWLTVLRAWRAFEAGRARALGEREALDAEVEAVRQAHAAVVA